MRYKEVFGGSKSGQGSQIILSIGKDSGGGSSGRAMAFCPSELGLNPGTGLGFFRNDINLFSLGVGLSLKRTGHRKCYTLFLLLSCFLSFKNLVNISIVSYNESKKGK